jgi:phosphoglycolate phosphatase
MSRFENQKTTLSSCVVFDLDGTLVHTAPDVTAILNAVLAELSVPIFDTAEVQKLMGEGIGALIEKALKARGCNFTEAALNKLQQDFVRRYIEKPVAASRPYPYALETLSELARRSIAIGVCTNKAEAPARLILECTGLLTHVTAVVGGDSSHGLKPAPGPLLACVSLLGVPVSKAVYVGDHSIDLLSARAAGVRFILAAYGYGGQEISTLGARSMIDCLKDLPATLETIE